MQFCMYRLVYLAKAHIQHLLYARHVSKCFIHTHSEFYSLPKHFWHVGSLVTHFNFSEQVDRNYPHITDRLTYSEIHLFTHS